MPLRPKTGFIPVIKRELQRMASRPLYNLLTIVFPLIAFAFFWIIFNQGIPRNLPVAVLDQDHSMLSHKITRMIDATASMKVGNKVFNMPEGRSLLRTGKCYALIVLPKHLEHDVLEGTAPQVINFYNNQFLLAGSIINRDVRQVIGTVSAGVDLSVRQKGGEMTAEAMAHIEPIQMKTNVMFNPYTNYLYFLAGTLNPTMLQIFVLMISIYALGIEIKEGTAKEWLAKAGRIPWKAVVGKLLPYTVIFLILGLFMNAFHFNYLAVPQRGSIFLIVLSTLFFILAYQAIALFLVSITANARFALSMGAFYSSTAFAFVGLTFPIMGMPMTAKMWATILPLNYYLKIFVDQSMRGASISTSLSDFAAIILFVLILPLIAMLRMPKLLTDSKYWGRI